MLEIVFFFFLLQDGHKIWLVFHLFKPLTSKRFYNVHYYMASSASGQYAANSVF